MITISFEQAAAYLVLRSEFARQCPGVTLPADLEAKLIALDKKATDHLVTFAPAFLDYKVKASAKPAPTVPQPKEPA